MYSLKNNIKKYYDANLRYDGREMGTLRELTVSVGVSKNAEGSSFVKLGDTMVYAGVKMAVEKPYDDTPNQGNLMVNAELTPIASPLYESGPPSDFAIEVSRVVDRAIRESHTIDLNSLCIEPREKVWGIIIDIVPINDAGNVLDASSIAALAALKNAVFPKLVDSKIDYKNKGDKLVLNEEPLLVTVYKIAGQLVVDPDYEEEAAVEARLSVGVVSNGDMCALQKGMSGMLLPQEILEAVKLAGNTAKEYRKALPK
ncbi:MAG: RNA-binding protein [Candidatus Woesearchaeota archaeon]